MTARSLSGEVRQAVFTSSPTGSKPCKTDGLCSNSSRGGANRPKSQLEGRHKAASKVHSASRAPPRQAKRCRSACMLADSYNAGGSKQEADQLLRNWPKTNPTAGKPSCSGPASAMSAARTQAALTFSLKARKRLPDPQIPGWNQVAAFLGTGPLARGRHGQAPRAAITPAIQELGAAAGPWTSSSLEGTVDRHRRDCGVLRPDCGEADVHQLKWIVASDDPLFLSAGPSSKNLSLRAIWPLPVPNPQAFGTGRDRGKER